MKLVNSLVKTPEVAVMMQEFSKEMTKAGVIEEIVNDTIDTALDSDDIEEEIEEVDKVLSEIAGEASKLSGKNGRGYLPREQAPRLNYANKMLQKVEMMRKNYKS